MKHGFIQRVVIGAWGVSVHVNQSPPPPPPQTRLSFAAEVKTLYINNAFQISEAVELTHLPHIARRSSGCNKANSIENIFITVVRGEQSLGLTAIKRVISLILSKINRSALRTTMK